jgi:hypothetical protein
MDIDTSRNEKEPPNIEVGGFFEVWSFDVRSETGSIKKAILESGLL